LPSERDELLDRVYARATGLWWRRRFAPIAAGVAAVLLLGIAVVPRLGADQPRPVHVAAEGATTTAAPDIDGGTVSSPTTVVGDAVASRPNMIVPTTIKAPTTATTRPTTTVPTDRCRNNNGDQSCGPFRWASDPGANAPLGFTITYSPQQPHAGEEVTFTVRVVDPDASPIHSCGDAYDDQPTFAAVGCAHTEECAANFGSWDVPPKQRGEATFTYKHAFVSAGQHTAEFHAESLQGSKSAGQCAAQPNPYASVGSQPVTLTVS
jgi:hypothetical protein